MAIGGNLITLLGSGLQVIGGIKTRKVMRKAIDELRGIRGAVSKLNDRILILNDTVAKHPSQRIPLVEGRRMKGILEPLPRLLGEDQILSTQLATPGTIIPELQTMDVHEILTDIRPLSYGSNHADPNMIPFLFSQSDRYFIGWQKQWVIQNLMKLKFQDSFCSLDATRGHSNIIIPLSTYHLGIQWPNGSVMTIFEQGQMISESFRKVLDVKTMRTGNLKFKIVYRPNSVWQELGNISIYLSSYITRIEIEAILRDDCRAQNLCLKLRNMDSGWRVGAAIEVK